MNAKHTLLIHEFVRAEALARSRRFTARHVSRVCAADQRFVGRMLDSMASRGDLGRVVLFSLPVYTPRAA